MQIVKQLFFVLNIDGEKGVTCLINLYGYAFTYFNAYI